MGIVFSVAEPHNGAASVEIATDTIAQCEVLRSNILAFLAAMARRAAEHHKVARVDREMLLRLLKP